MSSIAANYKYFDISEINLKYFDISEINLSVTSVE